MNDEEIMKLLRTIAARAHAIETATYRPMRDSSFRKSSTGRDELISTIDAESEAINRDIKRLSRMLNDGDEGDMSDA